MPKPIKPQTRTFMRAFRAHLDCVSPEMVEDLYGVWRALREADALVPPHWTPADVTRNDLKYLIAYVLTRVMEASAEPDDDEQVAVMDVEDVTGRPLPREVLDMIGEALATKLGGPVLLRTPTPPAPRVPGGDNVH